ncbi:hypothetical protein [Mitsuokella sp.]|uniref:hypothetical protein n=1 Tax=Mitsuokella sp. TaxID=2049034 RepID=UPI003D7CA116
MKDMNKAEWMIWKAAQDVVLTKRGKNEFTTADYAMGQFNAFCEMALSLEQTTEERIAEIKKMAIRKWNRGKTY